MAPKPTYEELEKRLREVEKKSCDQELELKNLKRSEERYRTLVELSPIPILVHCEERIVFINSEAVRTLGGKSTKDIIGRSIWDFVHPDSHLIARKRIKQIYEKREHAKTLQEKYIRLDGKVIDIEVAGIHCDYMGKPASQAVFRDITERKQAQEALQESQEKLRLMADSLPALIAYVDSNMHYQYLNAAYEEWFGISLRGSEGRHAREVLGESTFEWVRPHFEAVMSGQAVTYEVNLPHRRMGVRTNQTVLTPHIGGNGQVKGFYILSSDITDRKRAEEALRLTQFAIDHSSDPAFWMGPDARYIYVNKAACRVLGYSREELLTMTVHDIDPEFPQEVWAEHWMQVKGRGSFTLESRHRTKDGRIFPVEISVNYLQFGGKEYNCAFARDISERKGAEQALRESEERYRLLVENAPLGIFSTNRHGEILDVNPKLLEIFGSPSAEATKAINFLSFTPLVEAGISDAIRRCMKSGRLIVHEHPYTSKWGKQVYVRLNLTPIRDMDGQVIGAQAIVEDISGQKKLETQLQRAQKMEAIGTLAGGVAHDLNNVLTGIVSYPELLLMDIPQDSPLRKPILTIKKSGEKAAAIVQDLLTLARRGVAAMEVLNLNHVISEYLKSPEHEKLRAYYPEVQLELNLEKDLLNVLGSPVHLGKTIMNLVSNAAEAMPYGGKITLSTQNRYVDRTRTGYDKEEGDYVTLKVSDTGLGISSEDQERIFEPFYTKKAMGRSGTGLGMSVVWGTVKDHQGYIDVRSTEGKGTTFTLYFPVTRAELPKTKSNLSIEEYMGEGESILVVDDVEEQREIVSAILKKLGYSVISVSSGEEAVDHLKKRPADLVLLDMIMNPGIDGLETYQRIIELHPGQRAVIASGFSETDRVREAHRLGAGGYVKKPYTIEKIGIAIRSGLNK